MVLRAMVQRNGTMNYGTTSRYFKLWYDAVVLRAMVQRNANINYVRMTEFINKD